MATTFTAAALGSFPGANDKDKSARIPAAVSALNKALAGDAASLTYMRQQAAGSATAVGKAAFTRALALYDANKPSAAPSSTSTPVVGLIPIPRPQVLLAPKWPLTPPDRRLGWRLDPDQGWVFDPPQFAEPGNGVMLPVGHPKPVGFDPQEADTLVHSPVVSTMTVTGAVPKKITPITIGSADGGVVTGPPAPEYSGPAPAALAPDNFGYVDPSTTTVTKADGTSSTTTAPSTPSNTKILLVLGAGVVLWILAGSKRK